MVYRDKELSTIVHGLYLVSIVLKYALKPVLSLAIEDKY